MKSIVKQSTKETSQQSSSKKAKVVLEEYSDFPLASSCLGLWKDYKKLIKQGQTGAGYHGQKISYTTTNIH